MPHRLLSTGVPPPVWIAQPASTKVALARSSVVVLGVPAPPTSVGFTVLSQKDSVTTSPPLGAPMRPPDVAPDTVTAPPA